MKDSEKTNCQTWREHRYAVKAEIAIGRESKNSKEMSGRRGKYKRSGCRGSCKLGNNTAVGCSVRNGRGNSLSAEQAAAYVQSGIKAAGGTGVSVSGDGSLAKLSKKYGLRSRKQLRN